MRITKTILLVALLATVLPAKAERMGAMSAPAPGPAAPQLSGPPRMGRTLAAPREVSPALASPGMLQPKRVVAFEAMPALAAQSTKLRRPPLREVGLSDFLRAGPRFGNGSAHQGIFDPTPRPARVKPTVGHVGQ